MANEKNLKPFTSEQSREEAAKNGKKGGIASGKAKREKNAARKYLMEMLAWKPQMTADMIRRIKALGGDPDMPDITLERLTMLAMIQKSNKGDVRAAEFLLEMIGEDPRTVLEEKRLKLEKEAVKAIQNSDGFMDAMNGIAEEVFADGGDTPDAVEDE